MGLGKTNSNVEFVLLIQLLVRVGEKLSKKNLQITKRSHNMNLVLENQLPYEQALWLGNPFFL